MLKNVLFCLATFALASASAANNSFHLFERTTINGTTLRPGDYTLKVMDDKVVIRGDRSTTVVPAHATTGEKKFPVSSIRIQTVNGTRDIEEIYLGGTSTTIHVDNPQLAGNR